MMRFDVSYMYIQDAYSGVPNSGTGTNNGINVIGGIYPKIK